MNFCFLYRFELWTISFFILLFYGVIWRHEFHKWPYSMLIDKLTEDCDCDIWFLQAIMMYENRLCTNGRQSSGRQTICASVDCVTNQPGDSHLGDNFWTTGRHQLGHLGDRWQMTHVGSRDNNLYKVLSLKGKVLRRRRARQQQVESRLHGLWQKFAAGEICL